ncbi:MAG: D-alanyl-D-alanine endopeptidase [Rhodocyclales bacterium]|jgi:D-alanyl-D-alanine endopeptidase (penicillin-binding protein 7)|nr:D-alanyl-D-alanine endopeptidase [Rhodocyclales bacterium]MBH1975031.1 D-alanyl-D-alanine endopeptidase [Rhodocyclales bacterium]
MKKPFLLLLTALVFNALALVPVATEAATKKRAHAVVDNKKKLVAKKATKTKRVASNRKSVSSKRVQVTLKGQRSAKHGQRYAKKSNRSVDKSLYSRASSKHRPQYQAVRSTVATQNINQQLMGESSSALMADGPKGLALQSSAVLVQDQRTGEILYEKNAQAILPIASITKLMMAMVALDIKPDLQEPLTIDYEDVDRLKGTHSRLGVGVSLTREEMLRLALMSSENRAASALSRHYPGGQPAFIAAMNAKARALGLTNTRFFDPTGLTPSNVSSPRDLVKMVDAAHHYPLIREFTTTAEDQVFVAGRPQQFHNTNALVKNADWQIGLSKTGYISEAGRCLVMQAWINSKPTIIVLLDSIGKMTRVGDANRIKRWVETSTLPRLPTS